MYFFGKFFLKNDFASHVCHDSIILTPSHKNFVSLACSTSFSINNDIYALKKSVDCLGSTLSQCAMNHTRLESMSRKKHAPHMHAHPPRHTHAHHAHTYNYMYANVYTCTYCDSKGYLAKFCYDRINVSKFASKFIWVRKGVNPMNPRKFGYQNSSLFHLL